MHSKAMTENDACLTAPATVTRIPVIHQGAEEQTKMI